MKEKRLLRRFPAVDVGWLTIGGAIELSRGLIPQTYHHYTSLVVTLNQDTGNSR